MAGHDFGEQEEFVLRNHLDYCIDRTTEFLREKSEEVQQKFEACSKAVARIAEVSSFSCIPQRFCVHVLAPHRRKIKKKDENDNTEAKPLRGTWIEIKPIDVLRCFRCTPKKSRRNWNSSVSLRPQTTRRASNGCSTK
eukprot:3622327-Rhodomonas_salina.1